MRARRLGWFERFSGVYAAMRVYMCTRSTRYEVKAVVEEDEEKKVVVAVVAVAVVVVMVVV